MARPRVVIYAEASLDGRITASPGALLLFGDPRWPHAGDPSAAMAELLRIHAPGAMLEGSRSFVNPGMEPEPLPPTDDDSDELCRDTLFDDIAQRPGFRGWFVAVDGGGRVRWTYTGEPGREAPGSEGWHLLVLVSRATPPAYLALLRREHVPYLVVGDERVDLPLALDKLGDRLGVRCVLCTSPGKLGGALLRAGCVDEINVLWFPIVVGGTDTPSLFEGPDLASDEWPTPLSRVSCQPLGDGALWVRYEVVARPTQI